MRLSVSTRKPNPGDLTNESTVRRGQEIGGAMFRSVTLISCEAKYPSNASFGRPNYPWELQLPPLFSPPTRRSYPSLAVINQHGQCTSRLATSRKGYDASQASTQHCCSDIFQLLSSLTSQMRIIGPSSSSASSTSQCHFFFSHWSRQADVVSL